LLDSQARGVVREDLPETRVHLLGGFLVTSAGQEIELPPCTTRLVAFVALQERCVERSFVANCLWMDSTEGRAQANLRSCLWRLRRVPVRLVVTRGTQMRIEPGVIVDLDEVNDYARRVIDMDQAIESDQFDAGLLSTELLPDWYDDFVEVRREQLRQMQLHALEAMAQRYGLAGATTKALDLALSAVAAAPLRESGHRLVVTLHLAEGNVSEALRQFRLLQHLLRDELGIRPSSAMSELMRPWLSAMSSSADRPSDPDPRRLVAAPN
jgi:DNA-binding SARP family transcriptional activator